MVEEAVSYNELDYISVSAARVGSGQPSWVEQEVSLGVGPHPSSCRGVRSITVGCFCGALCPQGAVWPFNL